MKTAAKRNLVVLSETLPLGGTATFVMNLCRGMKQRGDWTCTAAGLRGMSEIGIQIHEAGLPIIAISDTALLHEDRIEEIYQRCAALVHKPSLQAWARVPLISSAMCLPDVSASE